MLHGKKALVFGERDDISGKTVSSCLASAGMEIVYETTACFVWTASGAVGLTAQEEVKKLADKYKVKNLIAVFGINQPATIKIMASTFMDGDPAFAGPLAGIALKLPSYHILELKEYIPADIWEQEMGLSELELTDEARQEIIKTMEEVRGESSPDGSWRF